MQFHAAIQHLILVIAVYWWLVQKSTICASCSAGGLSYTIFAQKVQIRTTYTWKASHTSYFASSAFVTHCSVARLLIRS
jgi:hypothetical protein